MSRLSTRASARTAYEEAFDSEWKGDLCFFVETILLLEAESKSGRLVKGRRRPEADVTWHRGLWLGRAEQMDEHVMGRNLVSSSSEVFAGLRNSAVTDMWSTQ